MIKFNPENKTKLTFGEALKPAMEITDANEAEEYLKDYIAHQETELEKLPRPDAMTAEQICKFNLGYFAGYYSADTRQRVYRLFNTIHPIFG